MSTNTRRGLSRNKNRKDEMPSEYEIRQPGRLVVAYLQPNEHFEDSLSESTVISVVRNINEVAIDSDLYKPVLALTKERDVLFHTVDGGFEISLYAAVSR